MSLYEDDDDSIISKTEKDEDEKSSPDDCPKTKKIKLDVDGCISEPPIANKQDEPAKSDLRGLFALEYSLP